MDATSCRVEVCLLICLCPSPIGSPELAFPMLKVDQFLWAPYLTPFNPTVLRAVAPLCPRQLFLSSAKAFLRCLAILFFRLARPWTKGLLLNQNPFHASINTSFLRKVTSVDQQPHTGISHVRAQDSKFMSKAYGHTIRVMESYTLHDD